MWNHQRSSWKISGKHEEIHLNLSANGIMMPYLWFPDPTTMVLRSLHRHACFNQHLRRPTPASTHALRQKVITRCTCVVTGARQSWCGCCPLCWPPTPTSCLKPPPRLRPTASLRVSCHACWSRATLSRLLRCRKPQVCIYICNLYYILIYINIYIN